MTNPAWAKSLNQIVGKRLQKLRHAVDPHPLTQQQLATRTKGALSRSSIASLERGLQGISLVQLYVLAQVLDTEPGELLPKRSEVLPTETPKVDELLRTSAPREAKFLKQVREAQPVRKGGSNA